MITKSIKIVVIEDNRDLLGDVIDMLVLEGYDHVEFFTDGRQAYQQLTDGLRADVIITDYQMPGIDGIELTKKLKTHGDCPKIIMFTANTASEKAAKAAGVDYYLTKPFEIQDLLSLIELASAS